MPSHPWNCVSLAGWNSFVHKWQAGVLHRLWLLKQIMHTLHKGSDGDVSASEVHTDCVLKPISQALRSQARCQDITFRTVWAVLLSCRICSGLQTWFHARHDDMKSCGCTTNWVWCSDHIGALDHIHARQCRSSALKFVWQHPVPCTGMIHCWGHGWAVWPLPLLRPLLSSIITLLGSYIWCCWSSLCRNFVLTVCTAHSAVLGLRLPRHQLNNLDECCGL